MMMGKTGEKGLFEEINLTLNQLSQFNKVSWKIRFTEKGSKAIKSCLVTW